MRSMIAVVMSLMLALASAGPTWAADDGGGENPAPSALVARLGAAKFTEREAAEKALEQLGRDALHALNLGRKATDPEVRARATALYQRLERAVLLGPTPVRIKPGVTPLGALVSSIERTANVPIDLGKLDLRHAIRIGPVLPPTLWQVLETAARQAPTAVNVLPVDRGDGRFGFVFEPIDDEVGVVPTSFDGVAIVRLLELDDHRARRFAQNIGRPVGPLGDRATLTGRAQVLVEPRLIMGHAGPVVIVEARDDRGNDLTPKPSPDAPARSPGVDRPIPRDVEFVDGPTFLEPFELAHPGRDLGSKLVVLRGSVPVALATRRYEGATLSLTPGSTATTERVRLNIVSREPQPGTKRIKVELVLRLVPGVVLDGFNPAESDPTRLINHQVDVFDPLGRPWNVTHVGSEVRGDELRLRLLLSPLPAVGPPVRLVYYDLIQQVRDISFTFQNVPLPE
jgi:hypothetical protein